jgi:type II secretory ATPase GspE/PulE/Tfp pilus assembly ATPase PilB-like protein/DNA-binding response OmpR family regulator
MVDYSHLFTGKEQTDDGANSPISAYRIMFVDDEDAILSALKRVFRKENYLIDTATSGAEALALMKKNNYHLVISDYMMPGMNGAEFLRQVKELYPETMRIMLTGHADTQAVMTAINEGAVYKFIIKPWEDNDLRVTVALALEKLELEKKNKALQSENVKAKKELAKLSKLAARSRSQLAIVLNKKKLLSDLQVQQLLKEQMVTKAPPIKIILQKGWVKEERIRKILEQDFFIESVLLNEYQVHPAVASLIPARFCRQQLILPISQKGKRVVICMADPLDEGMLEDLRFSSGLDFEPVTANVADIEAKLDELFGTDEGIDDIASVISVSDQLDAVEIIIEDEDDVPLEDLLEGTSEPPAIRLTNAIILEAIRLRASDIHIQPTSSCVLIRFRIDGVLYDKIKVPLEYHMALVSRIKVMAELDITERRRPQDGRITVKSPLRIVDLRLSTMPTINGEKIVMRILDRNSETVPLKDLGFSEEHLKALEYVNSKPQGIILATGPTGSGKTTTLYSLLKKNATREKNYVTIEDPVEYYMDRAGQVMVNEKTGVSFPVILKAVLRQDPDVILLGEIRDQETAEIAFQAALTGHVVYSTLHTNSALATLARLFDLGLRPYVVASALEAIVAQRLVRKICQKCRHSVQPDPSLVQAMGPAFQQPDMCFYKSSGCEYCNNSGYSSRVGIYEVLIPDDDMRQLIAEGTGLLGLTQYALRQGMKTLFDDAAAKVKLGLTSLDEVVRVLGRQRSQ